MEKVEINSGNLDTVSYDETTRQMHVHYKNGEYKIYYEVYKLDYVGLLSCENYTDYFSEKIEPRFPSKTITSS
ncbi:KTSC domain-containing protein [Evansella sp. AB-P1]|uniref:KTSC domain-containing protein n=1 Tax=Evansella sp. AB-P1 TaxID=3037653 RepID=UPI0024200BFF|nr:KTSC domain-containing protein [Evansella sp. AB-P1]MDG5786816.1 KTSC domain-containing protein [Evansella sp. AB-P1]